LTKSNAEDKKEKEEEENLEHLLEFANNLDIDSFMDDVEIKAQVVQMDEQLAQLQKLVREEEAEEKKLELKDVLEAESLERQTLNAANLSRLGEAFKKEGSNDDDDAASIATVKESTHRHR
jgi:hypothetical protein